MASAQATVEIGPFEQRGGDGRGRGGKPDLVGQHVAGADGDDAERRVGADQGGCDVADGAVAAGGDDGVVAAALGGLACGVRGDFQAGGGCTLNRRPAGGELPHHLLNERHAGDAGARIGDQEEAAAHGVADVGRKGFVTLVYSIVGKCEIVPGGTSDMSGFAKSLQAYEAWLDRQLGRQVVKADIGRKHAKMGASPFVFLRGTYWRWAETILEVCPDLAGAADVLAVGDIHLENFGTWRDGDGRLVWGVNDFDEAARMPYALDLVRLAASGVLASQNGRHQRGARSAGRSWRAIAWGWARRRRSCSTATGPGCGSCWSSPTGSAKGSGARSRRPGVRLRRRAIGARSRQRCRSGA